MRIRLLQIAILVLLAALVAVVAGCSSGDTAPGDAAKETQQGESPDLKDATQGE